MSEQVRLVAQHLEHEVGVLGLAQEDSVAALGVKTVGADHGRPQLQRRQQRLEVWDLIGSAPDLLLGQHHPGVGDRTQQVWRRTIATPGAAYDLAVHGHLRQRWPVPGTASLPLTLRLTLSGRLGWLAATAGTGSRRPADPPAKPAAERLLERVAVDVAGQAP